MPHESMPAGAGLNIPDPYGGVQGPGHHVDPVELKILNHEDPGIRVTQGKGDFTL